MGKFQVGNSGGGRPKGVRNKRTEQWESVLLLLSGLERFERELNTLEGKDYVTHFFRW
jgi:hypothetical protein